ncbi:MAG: tRNA preQ1(34) S-adenosylmethionine ribosyltransferase-isomerase QueA [Anaerolineae bacterium]
MNLSDFDYHLPEELIAQSALEERSASRLLTLNRQTGEINHRQFKDIVDFFRPGDILVANNSRVIPARLYGRKQTGGQVELLLLRKTDSDSWITLAGGKRLREGTEIQLNKKDGAPGEVSATIQAVLDGPGREVSFSDPNTAEWLHAYGHMPLPPYIRQSLDDSERYQTVYSRPEGSAAAPTAGLHFTPEILHQLRDRGVIFETVTLHVGQDTFKPVSAENITEHTIHSEWASLTPEVAQRINEAKLAGGRLISVGTTSTRTLETAALKSAGISGSYQIISDRDRSGETSGFCPWKPVAAYEGPTDLFIYPGYKYRAVDAMITNFHLPKSTLIMMISALAGRENVMRAYTEAVAEKYRFYSLGDSMLIHNSADF